MARPPKDPPFLAQEGYRRRRLADAARFVPALGGVLVFLPLLWPSDPGVEDPVSTSSAAIYLFSVWAVLIIAAGILAPWLGKRRNRR